MCGADFGFDDSVYLAAFAFAAGRGFGMGLGGVEGCFGMAGSGGCHCQIWTRKMIVDVGGKKRL